MTVIPIAANTLGPALTGRTPTFAIAGLPTRVPIVRHFQRVCRGGDVPPVSPCADAPDGCPPERCNTMPSGSERPLVTVGLATNGTCTGAPGGAGSEEIGCVVLFVGTALRPRRIRLTALAPRPAPPVRPSSLGDRVVYARGPRGCVAPSVAPAPSPRVGPCGAHVLCVFAPRRVVQVTRPPRAPMPSPIAPPNPMFCPTPPLALSAPPAITSCHCRHPPCRHPPLIFLPFPPPCVCVWGGGGGRSS